MFKAYVAIEIFKNSDPEGAAPKKRLYVAASPSGIMRIPIKMKKRKFKPGLSQVAPDDKALRRRLRKISERRPRWGYRPPTATYSAKASR